MAACVPTTSTLYVLSTSLSSSEVRTTITSTILNPVVVPTTIPVTLNGIVTSTVSDRTDTSTSLSTVVSSRTTVVAVVTSIVTGTSVSSCPVVTPTTTSAAVLPTISSGTFSITLQLPSSSSTPSSSVVSSTSTSFSTFIATDSAGVPTSTSVVAAAAQSGGSSMPVGAIVGGALGGVAALAALAILAVCCLKRPKKREPEPDADFFAPAMYSHGVRDSYNTVAEDKLPAMPPPLVARQSRASRRSRPSTDLRRNSSTATGREGVEQWAATAGSPRRESFRSSYSRRPEMAERYEEPAPLAPPQPPPPRRQAESISTAGIAGIGAMGGAGRLGRQPSATRYQPPPEPVHDVHYPAAPAIQPQPGSREIRQRANMAAGLPPVSEAGSIFGGYTSRAPPQAPSAYQIPVDAYRRPGPPSYTVRELRRLRS